MSQDVIDRAKAKLERIIATEGDMNGQRMEPWYLDTLVQEEMLSAAACLHFDGQVMRNAI